MRTPKLPLSLNYRHRSKMFASKAVSRQPTSLWSLLWIALSLTCVVAKRPNILFVITDDQDNHMDSIEHMPLLQKYITDEGTVYENHFCTIGSNSVLPAIISEY